MTTEIFTGFSDAIINQLNLESGQCHTFAIELGKLSQQNYTVFIGVRSEYSDELEDYLYSFSHAVVDINGIDYDCGGSNAIDRWESQWDDNQGEFGSSFEWVALENSPSMDDVTSKISELNLGYVLPDQQVASALRSHLSKTISVPAKKTIKPK